MAKFYLSFLFLFFLRVVSAQVVINELDSDSPSIDTKEFIELKSDTPNSSLDGYVVVLFNGSDAGGNTSYFSIDLDGFSTDINGLFLIGSTNVSPFPQFVIPPNVIQNGADAVAIYAADDTDFEDGTLATTENLIDALVYGTSDPDALSLMALLGVSEQIDEDVHSDKDFESIQRNNDGTYFVGAPTPRQNNDGSGVILNGIEMIIPQNQYDEGDSFIISFQTETPVTDEDLSFDFTLNNAGFDENDFTGNTNISIPIGQSSASTTIQLFDDTEDEGDEVLKATFGTLDPEKYIKLNDWVEARVVDNDFVVADYGTPMQPTFGVVENTIPVGYYANLEGLSGENLRQALQDIIADPSVVRAQTYADVIDILKKADQNPANSNEVWLVYTEQGRPKLDFQTSSINTNTWNREHTYPRSRGGFYSIKDDKIADGPAIYWTTNADSLRHGNSDAHALRAVDGPENSTRNNQNYGPMGYNGATGTAGSFKGDVARSTMYMAVRYNGLGLDNGYPPANSDGHLGDLNTLLQWARNDPPDDFEMNRNNIVYTWQFNRNPFIDQPELMEYIWGDYVGEVWHNTLAVNSKQLVEVKIYPNPTRGRLKISGIKDKYEWTIFSAEGRKLGTQKEQGSAVLNLSLASGVYFIRIVSKQGITTRKIIVK